MKKVLFMLLVMFALSACQSKDSYVKEFSDFVDKVEMEAADYTLSLIHISEPTRLEEGGSEILGSIHGSLRQVRGRVKR